ncbi:MAG: hypothetical protein ACKVUS_22395 [Saprospiraceae bacterium]
MVAIKGIYDGTKIVPLENLPKGKKFKVIITFIEEIADEAEEIRAFASQSDAFEFWESEAEDFYQDFLPSAN